MKRFAAFTLSFLSALLLLSATAYGIFMFSRPKAEDKKTEEGEEKIVDARIPLIAVYDDGDSVYAALLTLHTATGKCESEPIYGVGALTLKEYLDTCGFYPFIGAIREQHGVPDAHFLKFNENSFVKVADRSNNLVYNEKMNETVLLTGEQARALLSDDSFALLCRQIAEKSMSGELLPELLYLSGVVRNDLSYPELYDILSSR